MPEFIVPAMLVGVLLLVPLYPVLERYVQEKSADPKDTLLNLAALGVCAFVAALLKNPVAAGLLVICFILYRKQAIVLKRKEIQQKIDAQAEIALQMIAALYSTMGDMIRALEATSKSVGEPLSGEILRTVMEYRAGKTLNRALLEFAERTNNRDIDVFVKGVLLSEKYGTKTEDVVLDVAGIIRDRITLREEVKNEMKGQSLVINLFLSAIPIALVGSLLFLPDARYTLTETTGGKFLTCFLIVLEYVAWHVSRGMMGVADEL